MQDTEKSRDELLAELQYLRQMQQQSRESAGPGDSQQRETDLWCIIEDFPNEVYILDAETGQILQANRGARQTLGYSLPELQKLTVTDLIKNLTKQQFDRMISGLISGHDSEIEFTAEQRKKDGSLYPVEAHLQTSRFANKRVILAVIIDISNRLRTEEALRKSEQRYRTLVERMREGLLQVDNNDVIQFVNQQFCDLTGYSRDELIGQVGYQILLQDSQQSLMRQKLKRRQNYAFDVYELQLKKKSGDLIWVQVSGSPILDDNGNIIGSIGLHTDISERKRVEQALRESEERYRRFFEEDLSGDFETTPDGQLLECNQAFADMLGFDSVADARRTNMTTVYESKEQREEFLQELRQKGKIQYAERELIRKDGTRIHVIENVTGRFKNGKLESLRGYIFDITKRKNAEQALRESEQRFRDLFDNAPDMYLILDTNGTILDVNQKGVSMLGYDKAYLIGNSILRLLHANDLHTTKDALDSILKTDEVPRNMQVRFRDKSGQNRWFSKNFSVLYRDDDSLKAIRAVCRDITEHKQLEEELARSHRLESAGRVAGQIAHDFNNLLAPLMAYPALIREDLKAGKSVSDLLQEMESAARKIAEINQQLLALGRRGHYTMEAINLNDLIERVIATHSYPRELVVHKELAEDLLPIKGGAAQLTRALTNLILNAKEAMQDMGVLTVRTQNVYLDEPLQGYQTVTRGEYVKLTIEDQGAGIEPEIINRIFEPFFTTKKMDRMRGSGLGLSIVHGIIEDHQGYITVETQVGGGTVFSVFFPITREQFDAPEPVAARATGGSESVLVVDDDPLQRKVMSELLERLGYQVASVASGEAAVQYLQKHHTDLVIIDMVMDGMDGAETYREIRGFRPEQKAIIFSGYAMSQRVEEALRLGADAFLSKPVHLSKLAARVRQVLDGTISTKLPE